MKIRDMPTQAEVLAQEMEDPAFRAEWERTALAHQVALAIIGYRTEHGLSQRQLAEQLGWKQPAVARLELGEFNPSFATLRTLSARLGLALALDITPTSVAFAARPARGVARRPRRATPEALAATAR